MVEINESERKKEKQMKRNEDNLRDPWGNVKHPNIRIRGVPEEEDKKKDHEKILEEIIFENFPKMGKELITHSSTLAWKIPWTEEPGGLPSMGLHRVRHA